MKFKTSLLGWRAALLGAFAVLAAFAARFVSTAGSDQSETAQRDGQPSPPPVKTIERLPEDDQSGPSREERLRAEPQRDGFSPPEGQSPAPGPASRTDETPGAVEGTAPDPSAEEAARRAGGSDR